MRMTRILLLCVLPASLLTSCDPFDIVDKNRNRPAGGRPIAHQQPGQGGAQPPEPDMARPVEERYPVAERTQNHPNQVISPYPPFNVIDITGFNPGQLARDPSNNRIFRIP